MPIACDKMSVSFNVLFLLLLLKPPNAKSDKDERDSKMKHEGWHVHNPSLLRNRADVIVTEIRRMKSQKETVTHEESKCLSYRVTGRGITYILLRENSKSPAVNSNILSSSEEVKNEKTNCQANDVWWGVETTFPHQLIDEEGE